MACIRCVAITLSANLWAASAFNDKAFLSLQWFLKWPLEVDAVQVSDTTGAAGVTIAGNKKIEILEKSGDITGRIK